jgi:hypothetical protein
MQHSTLGNIIRDERGDGVARILYGGRTLEIRILEDELSYEETLAVTTSVVQNLKQLDDAAKKVAASELTETYNGGWNEYDQAQEDGTFKTVRNPKLTELEFAKKLTLHAVNVTGDMVDFFYDDENMFWGHSIVVSSMDGAAFTETHAEIFG